MEWIGATTDGQPTGAVAPVVRTMREVFQLPHPMNIAPFFGTGACLAMPTCIILGAVAPRKHAVVPRRPRLNPPMPHTPIGARAFNRRAPLWMRRVDHRAPHGMRRHPQVPWGPPADRPPPHPGHPAPASDGMECRFRHARAPLDPADLVLPPMAPPNRRQRRDGPWPPRASDRDRAALPLFWAGAASPRRRAGCAPPSREWRWGSARAVRAPSAWERLADGPAVRPSRPGERRPSPPADGDAVRWRDRWSPSVRPNAGWCADARQTGARRRIGSFLHDTVVGSARGAPGSRRRADDTSLVTCTIQSEHPPEVR